jgi:hypothetical protein
VLVAGLLSTALLSLSLTGTFSTFTAAITNTTDTAGTGALVMQETGGAATCLSSDATASCSTINKYGGNLAMAPGDSSTTTVTIANTGTVNASSLTLAPGSCVQSANGTPAGTATDFCTQLAVALYSGTAATGTPVYAGPASGLSTQTLPGVAAGASQAYTFKVSLPTSLGNTYTNLKASQPLAWTFTS